MDNLVSIVVPFFNVEKYIGECLSSIMRQTYTRLDIILVNDGSTDESRYIVNQYAKDDDRMRIIDLQENSLTGKARNVGMEYVKGDFLLFVDADDHIPINMVEYILERMVRERTEILLFNAAGFEDETQQQIKTPYFDLQPDFFNNGSISAGREKKVSDCHSACLKMYDFGFIKRNAISFPVGIYGEDVEFWIRCLLAVKRISYFDYIGYYRRYRSGSIMTSGSIKNVMDRINNFENLLTLTQYVPALYDYIMECYIPVNLKRAIDTKDDSVMKQILKVLHQLKKRYA